MPIRDNAPSYATPWVTITLIIINIAVFIQQLTFPGGFDASLLTWGEVPARILAGELVPGTHYPAWVTMFTSMFLHGDIFHIFGNMYFLWLFGDNVEWLMGRFRYIIFYVLCGLLASVATVYLGQHSDVPGIGASGAIAGVMAAYIFFYPRAKITSIFYSAPFSYWYWTTGEIGFIYRNISSFWFIGSWILFQVLTAGYLIANQQWMNYGIYAHAGGAIAGLVLSRIGAIPSRIPLPDDPCRSDPLTSMVVGDEGDAGGSEIEPAITLNEELNRLHRMHGGDTTETLPFRDYYLEELIDAGSYDKGLAHAREMRQMAVEQNDTRRVKGYDIYMTGISKRKLGGYDSRYDWHDES